MRINIDGIQAFFIIIFLTTITSIFLTGFNTIDSGASISRYFFYLLIVFVFCLHIIIGRVDFIFVVGCILVVGLKVLSVAEIISDTLMMVVIAWGISYVRYDLTKLHFNLIFTYGCLSILVAAFQVLGVEQLHTWNTLMTNSQGEVDAGLSRFVISSPMSLVEQAQVRPPGLFHSSAIFSLFVCYFYALVLQKSIRFLPLGLFAIWICGSKIAFLFSFLYPLVMIYTRDDLPKLFLFKVILTLIIFFLATFLLSPELAERRYSFESFIFSSALRLRDVDDILNLGIDFSIFSVLDGMDNLQQREESRGGLSGIVQFTLLLAPLMIFGLKRLGHLFRKNNAELMSALFVSLATPITGNPFFVFLLYPIFSSFRTRKA